MFRLNDSHWFTFHFPSLFSLSLAPSSKSLRSRRSHIKMVIIFNGFWCSDFQLGNEWWIILIDITAIRIFINNKSWSRCLAVYFVMTLIFEWRKLLLAMTNGESSLTGTDVQERREKKGNVIDAYLVNSTRKWCLSVYDDARQFSRSRLHRSFWWQYWCYL